MDKKETNGLQNGSELEISGFVRQLSNEIRNPINTIMGSAELISHEDVSDKVRETLVDIRQAADKLRILTEDMVDIIRISNDEIEVADDEYCFEDLILELRSGIERDANARGMEYQIDIDGTIPYRLFGDAYRLKQVLTKLILNAFDFARHKIEFTVKCMPASDGKVFIKFEIVDDGMGLLLDETVRVLCGKGASYAEGLSGLNLAAVGAFFAKYFAGRMGGKLSAKARQGESCTFTLLVCQGKVGEATLEDHYEIGRLKLEQHIPFTAPDTRVLIVQEDVANARINQGILGKYLINADFTDSCEDALRLVERIPYDLVLVDVSMPGHDMDGYKFASAVRTRKAEAEKRDYYAKLPVIGLTSTEVSAIADDAKLAGLTDCLKKPMDVAVLERILRESLPADKVIFTKEFSYEGKGLEVLDELGLNTADALANFQGDEEEYKNVLLTLCRSSDTKGKLLKYYVDQHDYKNYIVAVHGILGVAQMIGAEALANKSRELEQAAKQGLRELIERETEHFADAFDKLLSSVRNAIMTKDTVANKGAIDKEDLVTIIDELKGYLAEYQLNEVEELFFTLAQFSYPDTRVMELIHKAEEQMLSYSYNDVAATLDEIKDELDT